MYTHYMPHFDIELTRDMESLQTRFRSISLPARLHPIGQENELQKVNCLALQKGFPQTSEGIKSGLARLEELYGTVQEVTLRSSISNHHNNHQKSTMEELLTDSVDLLDACSAIGDLFRTVRENVQALQSALRRRGMNSGDIATYFNCRKRINKITAKTLKLLKQLEHRNADHGDFSCGLRESTAASIWVFRSVLGFLNSSTATRNSAAGGWSLISRLMLTKSASSEVGTANEIGNVDLALKCLQGKMRKNGARVYVNGDDQVRRLQVSLQTVDDVIRGFEEGMERVLRQLVQTRVNLLNILTDHL